MLGFHLVSDLDGTWIPERGHQGELRQLEASVHHQVGTVLTFATGRTFTSAMKLIRQWHLMEPDHLITDVGCALWHRWGKGIYEEDMVYASMVSARWPEESAERLVGFWMPKSVQRQFGVASTRRLALQPAAGVPLKRAETELRDSMQACGMRADVLASHGRYLDVLPRGVDKGSPCRTSSPPFTSRGPLCAAAILPETSGCSSTRTTPFSWGMASSVSTRRVCRARGRTGRPRAGPQPSSRPSWLSGC
ncbi:MAG: hypothetical protein IPL96_05400 [Holophagaceae bacterium]|nr:hypothetical protein [Holophagaceae bacterium]